MFILFRWWREIGEQPCVWSNFELRFIRCDMTHLLEVLSLGRLQALEQLHWVPCVRYDLVRFSDPLPMGSGSGDQCP